MLYNMKMKQNKTDYIQIRINKKEKAKFVKLAELDNMSLSNWILNKLKIDISPVEIKIIYGQIAIASDSSYALAFLNDSLMKVPKHTWSDLVSIKPENLNFENLCYVASMIEHAAEIRELNTPLWVNDIGALQTPYFVSTFKNLRLYLLINSPVSFRKRNIFIDASIGDRV